MLLLVKFLKGLNMKRYPRPVYFDHWQMTSPEQDMLGMSNKTSLVVH